MVAATEDRSTRIERLLAGVDWKLTGIVGSALWLVGYVISYVIVTVAKEETRYVGTDELATIAYLDGMGGHFDERLRLVPLEEGYIEDGGAAMSWVYEAPKSDFWGVGVLLHYVVPAVLLVIAGYWLAGKHAGAGDGSFEDRLGAWLGGVSLAVPFGALTILAAYVLLPSINHIELTSLLLAAVVYPTVFAGLGAARRVGFGILSVRSVAQGLGAFLLAAVVWNVVTDPFGDVVDVTELSGHEEYLGYFGVFLADHGAYVTPGQRPLASDPGFQDMGIVAAAGPALVVLLAPAVVAGVLVYRDDIRDPIVGLGEGARIAAGYALGVTLLVTAMFVVRMNKLSSQLDDAEAGQEAAQEARTEYMVQLNEMFGGLLPQVLLIAGILWPIVACAIGGFYGVKIGRIVEAD